MFLGERVKQGACLFEPLSLPIGRVKATEGLRERAASAQRSRDSLCGIRWQVPVRDPECLINVVGIGRGRVGQQAKVGVERSPRPEPCYIRRVGCAASDSSVNRTGRHANRRDGLGARRPDDCAVDDDEVGIEVAERAGP